MDPELGMGIEFLAKTSLDRQRLKELIQQMSANPAAIAEVLVEPEGLDWDIPGADSSGPTTRSANNEVQQDPLLDLFRGSATLPREQFLVELEKYQLSASNKEASDPNPSDGTSRQRREPRIAVSLPVEVWDEDHQEPVELATSMIDVSHRGARVHGIFDLKAGEVVHLVSAGIEARFKVIWVGGTGTPQEGQIGLESLKTDNSESEA